MTKQTITAICDHLVQVSELNKAMVALSSKLMNEGRTREAEKVYDFIKASIQEGNKLMAFVNEQSMQPA